MTKDEALKLARHTLNTMRHQAYMHGDQSAFENADQAINAIEQTLAAPVPLTDERVWANDELMKLNAVMMLPMDYFMRVVRAIEAAHGIKEKNA